MSALWSANRALSSHNTKVQRRLNTLGNTAGLCCYCHEAVHKDEDVQKALKDKKSGLMKKYAALSALNQAIPFIYKRLVEEFGKEHVFTCTGRETA